MELGRHGLDAVSRLAQQVRGPTLRFPVGSGRVVAAARRRVVRLPDVRWADPVTPPVTPALAGLARRITPATPMPRRAMVAEPARLSTSVPMRRAPADPVRAVRGVRSDPVRAARAAMAVPDVIEGVDRVLLRIGLPPGSPNPAAVSEPVALRPMPGAVEPYTNLGLPVPATPERVSPPARVCTQAFAPGLRNVASRDPVLPTAVMAAASDPVTPTTVTTTISNPLRPTAAGAIRPVAVGGPAAPRMPDPLPVRPTPSQPIAPRSARPMPPPADAGDADNTAGATPAASATGGAVLLDGQLVGQWLWDRMARDAERPPAGLTGFDVRRAPAWSLG